MSISVPFYLPTNTANDWVDLGPGPLTVSHVGNPSTVYLIVSAFQPISGTIGELLGSLPRHFETTDHIWAMAGRPCEILVLSETYIGSGGGSVSNGSGGTIDTSGLAKDSSVQILSQGLGTDGASPPALPGNATGVRGWLRYVASLLSGTLSVNQLLNGSSLSSTNRLPVDINAGSITLATTVATLPLPAGAATAANQNTGNGSLGSIDVKTPALVSGRVPVDGSGVTQPISGQVFAVQSGAWSVSLTGGIAVTQSGNWSVSLATGSTVSLSAGSASIGSVSVSSGTITANLGTIAGVATAALQTTGNGYLQSIAAGTPASLGQKTMAGSLPVTLASDQPVLQVQAGSLPLPAGAATSAAQTTMIAGLTQIHNDLAGTISITSSSLPLPTGAATAAGQASLHADLGQLHTDLTGTINVAAAALPLPAGAATETTLQAIKNALLAQIDLANLIVTDGTSFYVRREIVENGVYTVSFETLDGAAATPNTSALTPVTGSGSGSAGSTRVTETALYDVLTGGTGYSAGDLLARVLVYDTAANSIVASYWHNFTTGAALASAPTASNIAEQARLLPAGAATSASQATQLTALQAIQALLAGTLNVALPANAATAGAQGTGNASLASIDGKTPALASGRVPVDGSGVTQPVSGTLGATQSGSWTISVSNLPATQAISGSVGVTSLPALPTGTNAIGSVTISNFPATQTIAGTITVGSLPALPAGNNAIGSVTVSNLPATQNVTGSVTVSNLPATQAVSGTVTLGAGAAAIGSVTISNLPPTQAVSGTITVGSLPSLPAGTNAIGSVTVSNFPATQPVSGSISVANFPASQVVTGTISVGNFPASQIVTGTVALAAGSAAIGSVTVSNLPATQAVSGQVTSVTPSVNPVDRSGVTSANIGQFSSPAAANAFRQYLSISLHRDAAAEIYVWYKQGNPASLDVCLRIDPGQIVFWDSKVPVGVIQVASTAASIKFEMGEG